MANVVANSVARTEAATLPAEFGRKIVLDEGDGGLITRYALMAGNPTDAPNVPRSVAQHQMKFGRAPTVLSADRGFCTRN